MPKIPKAVGGRPRGGANGARRSKGGARAAGGDGSKGRASKADAAAKVDGKPAARTSTKQRKVATKAPAKRTAAKAKANGGKARAGKPSLEPQAAVDYARRPVDDAPAATTQSIAVQLNELERGLLADLFAVIEEDDEAGHLKRDSVERALVFACARHAHQRRR